MEMNFNGLDCEVLNFTDITAYKKLKQEDRTNNLLAILNESTLSKIKDKTEESARISKLITPQINSSRKMQEMIKKIQASFSYIFFLT